MAFPGPEMKTKTTKHPSHSSPSFLSRKATGAWQHLASGYFLVPGQWDEAVPGHGQGAVCGDMRKRHPGNRWCSRPVSG